MREFRTSGSVGGRRRDPAVYPTPYGTATWRASTGATVLPKLTFRGSPQQEGAIYRREW